MKALLVGRARRSKSVLIDARLLRSVSLAIRAMGTDARLQVT